MIVMVCFDVEIKKTAASNRDNKNHRHMQRYNYDTWPAQAGPLYTPIRPRFLGPGRAGF